MRTFYYHVVKGDIDIVRQTEQREYLSHSRVVFHIKEGVCMFDVISTEITPKPIEELLMSFAEKRDWGRLGNFRHFVTYLHEHWRKQYL